MIIITEIDILQVMSLFMLCLLGLASDWDYPLDGNFPVLQGSGATPRHRVEARECVKALGRATPRRRVAARGVKAQGRANPRHRVAARECVKAQGSGATPCHRVEARECVCLLYTSPSPRDRTRSRMPSSA